MFVYPRKFILKTCGTTTLLHAVKPFLELARSCGLVEIENVFYSRKCFIQPERQILPHGNFKSEVAELKDIFGTDCHTICFRKFIWKKNVFQMVETRTSWAR